MSNRRAGDLWLMGDRNAWDRRSKLARIKNADRESPLRATHYSWEITSDPRDREAELPQEFERKHARLPRCNARAA
jgi:hypothetical protein